MHDVAILHDVVLTLKAEGASRPCVGFRSGFQQLIPMNGFGANEMLFQIRVNSSGRLHSTAFDRNRPGAAFVFAYREERNQSHECIRGSNQTGEAAFGQAVAGEEFSGIGVAHFGQFGFYFAADRRCSSIGTRHDVGQLVLRYGVFQFFAQFHALGDVEYAEHGLFAEKHESADTLLVFGIHLHLAQRTLGLKMCLGADQQVVLALQFRRAHLLQVLLHALHAFFDLAKVADDKVEINILNVAQRIDFADVRNGGIVEGANNVGERVHLAEVADVGSLFQCLLSNRADVYVFDGSMDELFRVVECGQTIQSIVRDLGDSDVCLARVGEGVLGKLGLGQNAKQRTFAYLWQAYDSSFHERSF